MYIKCTKALAKELNKRSPYEVYCTKMEESEYRWNVSGFNTCDRDYDWNSGKWAVIVVAYPDDYYACNRVLTTDHLERVFTRNHCKTIEEFCAAFNEYVEI